MATRCPEARTTASTQVSMTELERALEELTQQVAEQKRQLAATFRHIHEMVAEREATLMAELDAIPGGVAARVAERGASLDQLRKLEEDTLRNLQANRLNAFLQQQLTNVRTEMDRILSEQILFPRVSASCHLQDIERTLEERCLIQERHNPYTFRTVPIWSSGKEGKGNDELYHPLCIDPTSNLIYVADRYEARLEVFTDDGDYSSTLYNKDIKHSTAIKIHEQFIYVSNSFSKFDVVLFYIIKLNRKGQTMKIIETANPIIGLFIETRKLYTCTDKSLTLQIYDLNLKPTNQIPLKIKLDDELAPYDLIVNKQQIIILFSNQYLPSQISIFGQDGTFIRTLATKCEMKSYYFCLDSYQNILVSESNTHCIRIFSPDGILLQSIGREGEKGPGELFNPRGIDIDCKGRIIVVDRKKLNKLQAF